MSLPEQGVYPTTRYELQLDVSQATGLPGAQLAVTVVAPATISDPPVLAVALPGGGYSRGYWDLQWGTGYSQAEYHASRGWIVAAVDHLGCGDSALVDPSLLTIEALAAADAAATAQLADLLQRGLIDPSLPALSRRPFIIGIGQSMGGCISIVAQATTRCFDSLAVLGFSAAHTVLPSPGGGVDVTPVERGRIDTDAAHASNAQISATDAYTWGFHYDDEDPALRDEDLRGGYPFRTDYVPPWGSATLPPAAAALLTPKVVAAEAAAIDTPVFVGLGERDVCVDPRLEPSCYTSASEIAVCVVPRMAHMHNFATTRSVMWRRIHYWGVSHFGDYADEDRAIRTVA